MELKTSFGWVEIDGKRYDFDIILFWDGEIIKRNKEKSKKVKKSFEHTPFSKLEVEDLLKRDVEVVYIGTGQYGAMPVREDAIEEIKKKGVELIIDKTPKILEMIKNDKRKWVALIHVTC